MSTTCKAKVPKTVRNTVLKYVTRRFATGATSDEIEKRLRLPHQTASARLSDLERDGLIYQSHLRRKTRQGGMARAYLPV